MNCQLSLLSRSEMTLSKDMRWDGVSGMWQLFYIWLKAKNEVAVDFRSPERLSDNRRDYGSFEIAERSVWHRKQGGTDEIHLVGIHRARKIRRDDRGRAARNVQQMHWPTTNVSRIIEAVCAGDRASGSFDWVIGFRHSRGAQDGQGRTFSANEKTEDKNVSFAIASP